MIGFDDITACLVTRGNVDMGPIIEPLPTTIHINVWNNAKRDNMRVWGRFEAAFEARTPYVYFQDDDVVFRHHETLLAELNATPDVMVAVDGHGGNYGGYEDLAWTCSGAIVSNKLMYETWKRWFDVYPTYPSRIDPDEDGSLLYECDVVFGILCPHRQIELPWTRLYADDRTRMCGQPWQEPAKKRYVEMARRIRDADNA